MHKKAIQSALNDTLNAFKRMLPLVFGVLLIISYLQSIEASTYIVRFFTGNLLFDTGVGAVAGSILTGNPITSYILAGELKDIGVHLVPVTAFLVAWVTVGVVQLPAEITIFGKRYAIIRNAVSFVSAVCIALLLHVLLTILS